MKNKLHIEKIKYIFYDITLISITIAILWFVLAAAIFVSSVVKVILAIKTASPVDCWLLVKLLLIPILLVMVGILFCFDFHKKEDVQLVYFNGRKQISKEEYEKLEQENLEIEENIKRKIEKSRELLQKVCGT